MGTNEILMLIGLIFVMFLVLKFIWYLLGKVIKLIILSIFVVCGIYIVKPEILYNIFGKEKIEATANSLKDGANKAIDEGTRLIDSLKKDTISN